MYLHKNAKQFRITTNFRSFGIKNYLIAKEILLILFQTSFACQVSIFQQNNIAKEKVNNLLEYLFQGK